MKHNSEILFGVDDVPNPAQSTAAAFQHVLACFVGIITPTLIVGAALGLGSEIPYLISMSLFVSGVATFVQAKRIGPVGSGMISVQGTSFAFIGALLVAGVTIKERGGSNEEILSTMLGISFFGAFIEIILSQFVEKLKRFITPLTTGIVIMTIGISLIKVGMTDIAGGFGNANFGSTTNLGLGAIVLLIILLFNLSKNPWLRLSSILIAMAIGSIIAAVLGWIDLSHLNTLPIFAVPEPFKYGLTFDIELFLPIAIVYLLTAIETSGDLTANCLFCKLPIKGAEYYKRIKGGILADGCNSLLAAIMNTFPNSTFSQNNAVVQLTGVASRHVGFYVAGILVILGLFPIIGGVFQAIPKPVLGGATLVMFGTIAVGGLRIITAEKIDRRASLIIATSMGTGLGVMMVPNAIEHLPIWLKNIFSSPVSTAGLCAIIMALLIPESKTQEEPVLNEETSTDNLVKES
ncbi:uracil-xanthine permease family protein [Glaciecola sp. 1036]|uniref:uracil-xanthine permease family protein n=1 Tax=Alteromonadaceae TaxID=72275 RepID=UPI003D02EF14